MLIITQMKFLWKLMAHNKDEENAANNNDIRLDCCGVVEEG
jgi:hypothetical protein